MPDRSPCRVDFQALVPYALITFAITWTIAGAYIFFPDAMEAQFGQIGFGHPLYFLATWAPAIAGFAVVAAAGGTSGLKAFLTRVALWRSPAVWWLLILSGIPLVYMAGSAIKGGPILAPLPPQGIGAAIVFTLMMLFLGPIEEFGWRGVAQPLLQRRMAPFWAGAIIGTTWGIWHLPAFYLSGVVYQDWHFLPFFIGNVTLGILVTPLFNASRGSILLPALFHWQLINPFWSDAQPWDTWLFVAFTVAVTIWKWDEMFSRRNAVTEVIPA